MDINKNFSGNNIDIGKTSILKFKFLVYINCKKNINLREYLIIFFIKCL